MSGALNTPPCWGVSGLARSGDFLQWNTESSLVTSGKFLEHGGCSVTLITGAVSRKLDGLAGAAPPLAPCPPPPLSLRQASAAAAASPALPTAPRSRYRRLVRPAQ